MKRKVARSEGYVCSGILVKDTVVCYVYAYAHNGVYKRVKVTVK